MSHYAARVTCIKINPFMPQFWNFSNHFAEDAVLAMQVMQVWPRSIKMSVMQLLLTVFNTQISLKKLGVYQRMTPILKSPKSVEYLRKALLVVCLQLLVRGSLAKLVVNEKDFVNLQLDQVQDQAELVEDTILPRECRRQVKNLSI